MPPPGTPVPPPPMGTMGAMPAPMPMDGLMSSIAGLMQSMPKTSMEKVRDAVKLLKEARDDDPKIGENLSIALGVIKHGPDVLEKYDTGESKDQPSKSSSTY